MTTDTITVRDKLQEHENLMPTETTKAIADFTLSLNANGRQTPAGHRSHINAQSLAYHFPLLLTGGMGLAAQLHAYRRIRNIKTAARGPWQLAAVSLLADVAQMQDSVLSRSRAERIANDALALLDCTVIPMLQQWLDGESE